MGIVDTMLAAQDTHSRIIYLWDTLASSFACAVDRLACRKCLVYSITVVYSVPLQLVYIVRSALRAVIDAILNNCIAISVAARARAPGNYLL